MATPQVSPASQNSRFPFSWPLLLSVPVSTLITRQRRVIPRFDEHTTHAQTHTLATPLTLSPSHPLVPALPYPARIQERKGIKRDRKHTSASDPHNSHSPRPSPRPSCHPWKTTRSSLPSSWSFCWRLRCRCCRWRRRRRWRWRRGGRGGLEGGVWKSVSWLRRLGCR